MMSRVWTRGQVVVHQETWGGGLWAARPMIVLLDVPDLLLLWMPAGTVRMVPTGTGVDPAYPAVRKDRIIADLARGHWKHEAHEWDVSTLVFLRPGDWFGIWTPWLPNGEHFGYYINLQMPYRRTDLGIEAMDLMLDVVVQPDLHWQWKDDDEFDEIVQLGLYDRQLAAHVRAEAARAIGLIQDRAAPFDGPLYSCDRLRTSTRPACLQAGRSRSDSSRGSLCRRHERATRQLPAAEHSISGQSCCTEEPHPGTPCDMTDLAVLLDEAALRAAVDAELDSPPRQLPPSSVSPALQARRDEAAAWALGQIGGSFVPTPEEVVPVSKAGHGVRPVAIWDLPSRLAYRALAERLRPGLPPVDRGKAAYRSFLRAPLADTPKYVVASDIAACYEQIDHALLSAELVAQTGDHAAVDGLAWLLQSTGGRRYGLPQQSPPSDLLADAFLRRLERALVRRGLNVSRYSDDFRFACSTWSEVARSVEVLASEARMLGLTVNELKTVTWGAAKYTAHLDEADRLRQEIADEAEIDLTQYDQEYDGTVVGEPPTQEEIDAHASVLVLERWARVAGRGRVAQSRKTEHRAVLDLLPAALARLSSQTDTNPHVLELCNQLLRFERTTTPAVASFLTSRDEAAVLASFDRLLKAKPYLNGWQTWWLQQPTTRHAAFATGAGAKARVDWARAALVAADHTPVLRAHAALVLARHGEVGEAALLGIYDRSSATVRPVVAAAVALLKPSTAVRDAVTGDSALNRWTYEWAERFA